MCLVRKWELLDFDDPNRSERLDLRSGRQSRYRVKKLPGLLTLNGQIDHNSAHSDWRCSGLCELGEAVTGVSLKVTDVLNANEIVREVGNQLDVYMFTCAVGSKKFGFLYRDIQLVRTIMYLVMVLVIGVACFNIVSTLMMAVKDRASEIAIT